MTQFLVSILLSKFWRSFWPKIWISPALILLPLLTSKGMAFEAAQASTYPFALEKRSQALGGQFLPVKLTASDTLAFLIKRRSALGADANVIEVWQGIAGRGDSAVSLSGAHIQAAEILDDQRILVLAAWRDTLWAASIGRDLQLYQPLALPLQSFAPGIRCAIELNHSGNLALFQVGSATFAATVARGAVTGVKALNQGQVFAMQALPPSAPLCANGFALIRQIDIQREVLLLDSLLQAQNSIETGLTEADKLALVGDQVIVAMDPLRDFTNLAFLDYRETYPTQLATITAKWYNIAFGPQDVFFYHINFVEFDGTYRWMRLSLPVRGGNAEAQMLQEFPPGFVTPIGVHIAEPSASLLFQNEQDTEIAARINYVVFRNGFISLDADGMMLSANRFEIDFNSDAAVDIRINGSLLTATQEGRSYLFERVENTFWWINQLVRDFWVYLIILIVVTIIVLTTRYAYRRRQLLSTLFEMDFADAFIVLDRQSRLRSLNDTARGLLRLPVAVPLRRFFHFYCAELQADGLVDLAEEALRYRAPLTKRINFVDSGTDYLFSAFPIRGMFGNVSGLLLTGRDITEELEKKRLNNWAQLAHDMKTNLSIIKLNAENLSEMTSEPSRGLGTRIMFQVNLLISRVRDLVTIGASDKLEIGLADTSQICEDVRREFEGELFPNVEIEVDSAQIMLPCDRRKLERALRNAVENGIRALHGAHGKVEIRCWHDPRHLYFEVRDSGVGMDKETLENMARPFFTRYQREGGTGMGTMIMQHVMQLHGGLMEVESRKGGGTTVRFRLPNLDTKVIAERRSSRRSDDTEQPDLESEN